MEAQVDTPSLLPGVGGEGGTRRGAVAREKQKALCEEAAEPAQASPLDEQPPWSTALGSCISNGTENATNWGRHCVTVSKSSTCMGAGPRPAISTLHPAAQLWLEKAVEDGLRPWGLHPRGRHGRALDFGSAQLWLGRTFGEYTSEWKISLSLFGTLPFK